MVSINIKLDTKYILSTKYIKSQGLFIVILISGKANYEIIKTVEEYHHESRSWTIITNSMIKETRFSGAVAVSALLFRNIAEGCIGV